MFLTIHDAQLRKVAFVDNEKQGTLDFFDDTWTRNLQTGSSTYEFSISKKSLVSDTVFNRTYSYLNERAFVSFEYKGETFLFNVMTVEEDEKKIKCYCENLNLELINEYSNPFKADRAMSFVEYCNAMDLLNMTKLSVGINEISDYKRTLEWEGQDTKLARLISLANKFDAEIEFKTYLNDDSTIKQFLVNVYHENDGVNYHGVGRDRKDITLVYGKNIKTIRRKIDKTNIFNMIVPTAQSEENNDQKLTIGSLPNWELKNDKGIVEFYKRGDAIYAPISAQLYPSTFTSETQSDQWTRRDMDFNVKSIQQLETEGLKQLKASAYPELTYEFDGYIDADIGDTVQLSDDGFANILLIEARIFEQKLSFSTERNWKTTLGNFRALQNKLSNDIQNELERLIENAKPYDIRLSTDNGTTFKNNEGESLVKATLWKGGKVVNQDVSWRWALDGVVTVGMQYLVKAKDIDETAVLTVAAYVGNNEVATTEITLTNVNDGPQGPQGPQGPKGDKGDDGIAGKDGVGLKDTVVTYGLSTSEATQPTTWTAQVPTLTKGNYLWTKTVWTYTDNTSETGYQKTYIAKDGNDGADGIAGKDGVGIDSTAITYTSSTNGTTKPSSGWSSTIPSVPAGSYLWTKTVWTYTDGTSETGYSVAKMGETGAKGEKGDPGNDGLPGAPGVGIKSTVSTYGISSNETTQPTNWTTTVPSLVKGQYLWTKNVWTYTDGRTETGYTKTYIPKDGNNGTDGIAGKDGVGISSTTITYASSSSGTTAPTSGWTTSVPNVTPGQYLWTKTVWTYTDNTNETGYSVARMGANGTGHLTTWTFYKLSNSTSAPQVAPIGSSTNLSHLGPNNAWTPYKELSGGSAGWNLIDFDKIAKSNIIPDKPFTWYLEASFDGVSNFNGSTDFNIRFENWYVNSAGSNVYNPLGTRDFQANKFSATNDTSVNNYFSQSITWTVPRAVYDAIPEGGFLNLRIRIDRFTKLSYHAKNSYVTYGTIPSDPAQRGLGNYSTYGWKASPEAVTQALPYLWIYQIQFYDNGREVAIPPTLIGAQGLQGPKGDQGIQGPKGADGKTQYIHFAYADDNKGTNFSLTDKNQQYQGYYSDYTQADSTDYTKYKWADRWAKINVDGRNLAQKTSKDWSNPYTLFSGVQNTCINLYKVLVDGLSAGDTLKSRIVLKYTDIVPASGRTATIWLQGNGDVTDWNAGAYDGSPFKSISGSGEIVFEHEFKITTDHLKNDYWNWGFRTDWIASGSLQWKLAKVEKGTVFTGWSPAFEDTQEQIDSKADSALTQDQLNALEAKRLQMEVELKAKATLEQVSELETFINNLKQEDTDGRQKIIEITKAIEERVKDIEPIMEYSQKLQFMDTYITQGNGGMVIGANESTTKVVVTPDRISFQSGGSEVAYISQRMLHIDNGVFTMSLQLGHYITRAHPKNEYVNATYFVK